MTPCSAAWPAVLQSELRQSLDVAARYGGEEFAVILPNTPLTAGRGTQMEMDLTGRLAAAGGEEPPPPPGHTGGAEQVAERIRHAGRRRAFMAPDGSTLPALTVSIGVAVFPVRTTSPETSWGTRTPRSTRPNAPARTGWRRMDDSRPGAVAGRGVADLLRGVVADVGEALDLWSVDLWTFSDDADTLACRAYWCRSDAAKAGDCVGAVVTLDQSHDLRRLVLAAEVVERHIDDELSPADAGALAQPGFTSSIDVPLLAGAEVLGILSLAETRAGTPPHSG